MKLNEEQLRFFYNEVLGEIGWSDEDEEAGTDPLAHVLGEIRKMRKEIEKVKAAPANDPWCKKCSGFHKPSEACY